MKPENIRKKSAQVLKQAAFLITPKGSWAKGAFAKNVNGESVHAHSRYAVSWCALGACERAGTEIVGQKSRPVVMGAVHERLRRVMLRREIPGLTTWNDSCESSAPVIELLKQAAEEPVFEPHGLPKDSAH